MMKGQAAVELLMILAFAALLLLPFVWTALQKSQVDTSLLQAQKLVDDLANAAEYVYAQGPGSVLRIKGVVPPGVVWNESYIGKPSWAGAGVKPREIQLRIEAGAGYNDVWKSVSPNLRGSWPGSSGTYVFNVYLSDDGYVVITPYLSIIVNPHEEYLSIPAGNTSQFQYTVSNYLDHSVNVIINKTGEAADWLTLYNTSAVIPSQTQRAFNVSVAVPYNATAGLHYATITVTGANVTEAIAVTINVYNSTVITGNYTKPVYHVQTYRDAGYTIPWNTFYQGKLVNITGEGWDPNSVVTLNISNSGTPLPGFPKEVQTNSSGGIVYSFPTNNLDAGAYIVELNDSTDTRTTSFEVRECAG